MENNRFKFRAWDKESEAIIYPSHDFDFVITKDAITVYYLEERHTVEDGDDVSHNFWAECEEVEVVQFTGLCDKAGKEAYFSDLVKLPDSPSKIYLITKDSFGIPLFCNPTDCTQDVISFEEYFLHNGARKRNDFEIIGNIYETVLTKK